MAVAAAAAPSSRGPLAMTSEEVREGWAEEGRAVLGETEGLLAHGNHGHFHLLFPRGERSEAWADVRPSVLVLAEEQLLHPESTVSQLAPVVWLPSQKRRCVRRVCACSRIPVERSSQSQRNSSELDVVSMDITSGVGSAFSKSGEVISRKSA